MSDILIINRSKLIMDAEIDPVLEAINRQIIGDFAPEWGVDGTVHFGQAPASAWQFVLQDSIDDSNALGYHVDENGLVSAIIDIEACKASGADWRTVLGHEVLEALADPLTSRMAPNGIDIVEVCDPVEEDTYIIDGVPVTNFVLPAYFGFNSSTMYDKNEWLKAPAPALRPGGYIMQLVNGQWTNTFGERKGFMASRTSGRRAWRLRSR